MEKIAYNPDKCTFILVGGKLYFDYHLHEVTLNKYFGIPRVYGNAFRFLFPRGRALRSWDERQIQVEASQELETYKDQLIRELDLTPQNRVQWNFHNTHYKTSLSTANTMLSGIEHLPPDENTINFVRQYCPEIEQYLPKQKAARSNWVKKISQSFIPRENADMGSPEPVEVNKPVQPVQPVQPVKNPEEYDPIEELDATPDDGITTYGRYVWDTAENIMEEIRQNGGLPMYQHDSLPEGWFGIHTGGEEWVNILASDYGRDGVVCELSISGLPDGFYTMQDPDMSISGKVDSTLLFSRSPIIPADCIKITFEKDTDEIIEESDFDYDDDYWQMASSSPGKWLMKTAFPRMNAPPPAISLQEAKQTCIGPFYHGTSPENVSEILNKGFKWEEGDARSGGSAHGYEYSDYHGGCPAPVHHLGYGIYLTEVKNIAKDFGYGSAKNVLEFWVLKSANIGTINFGAPNTMMKWWNKWGYDCNMAKIDRAAATKQMTDKLASVYDAVLFTGKGLRRLLDGNQICIYNPDIIRRVDKSLTQPGEIGSKVRRKSDGMIGVFMNRRPLTPEQSQEYHNGEPELLAIKWRKGGTDLNVYPSQVDFI
jgi:hypothetical protein